MVRNQKSVVGMVSQERKKKIKNGSQGFGSIFMHADRKDLFFMILGTIGAVGEGVTTPLVLYISSRMINSIGSSSNTDGSTFIHNINKVQFYLSLYTHNKFLHLPNHHHLNCSQHHTYLSVI